MKDTKGYFFLVLLKLLKMQPIRIIIIDDHTLVREAWSFLLNRDPRFKVVAESDSAEDGIELCKIHRPDIIMLDINLPGISGMEAVPLIRKCAPVTRIMGVSLHTQPSYVKRMMQAGASGISPRVLHGMKCCWP